jgi:hypothetical protein
MSMSSPITLAPESPTSPAPVDTAAERRLARWIEQAAFQQTRALAWLRQTRDPARPLDQTQRRDLLLISVKHLLTARGLLRRAQQAALEPELRAILDTHQERLTTTLANAERLLREVEEQAAQE